MLRSLNRALLLLKRVGYPAAFLLLPVVVFCLALFDDVRKGLFAGSAAKPPEDSFAVPAAVAPVAACTCAKTMRCARPVSTSHPEPQ